MAIYTLTLSPAYDVHASLEELQLYHENLATITAEEAGGKGVNISRALLRHGVMHTSIVLLGQEDGGEFLAALQRDGLSLRTLYVPGRIRRNITLHAAHTPETRISFPGFSAGEGTVQDVAALLAPCGAGDYVTLTGRLPEGMPMPAVQRLLADLRARGVHVVIDSRSFDLAALLEARPYLIKPNEEELTTYAGQPVQGVDAAAEAVCAMQQRGILCVMASLGADGAVLACPAGCFHAAAPVVPVRSTIGAGDSAVAGFLAAAAAGREMAEALRCAVAFGSAAVQQAGTRPPQPEDVATLYRQICVTRLA